MCHLGDISVPSEGHLGTISNININKYSSNNSSNNKSNITTNSNHYRNIRSRCPIAPSPGPVAWAQPLQPNSKLITNSAGIWLRGV